MDDRYITEGNIILADKENQTIFGGWFGYSERTDQILRDLKNRFDFTESEQNAKINTHGEVEIYDDLII